MEKPFSWRNWKRRRRFTLVGYVIIGTVISIDYSVVIATLFSYLHHVIKLDQSEIYYGIIITAFSISSTLCGALAGRWVDKTRNVKNYLNFICVVQVVGSLIYAMPYSVLFPVVGRLLVGVGDPFHNIVSGELIRIYDEPEGIQALWGIASTYSIGFIVGPAASLIFKNVDFHIGKLHITYFNFVGLFMSALMIVSLIVTNTMVYNCSKEFDLKETMKTRKFKIDDFKQDDGVSEPILNAEEEYKTGENVIDGITTAVKITEKENEKSNDYNANLISNRRRKKERSGKDGTSSTTTNNESNINDNSTNDSCNKIELNRNNEDNERNDSSLNNKNSKTIMNNNNNNNRNNNSINNNNSNSNTNNENKINSSNSKMTNNDVIPWLDVLSKVCSNKDTLLIIISTFFFNYALFSSDILIPLVCLVTFKWNISSLTYIFIGYGAAYFLVLVLLSRLCKNSHSVYHCLLLCIVMQVLQYVFLLCISVLERDEYRDVVLMTLFLLSGMFVWTIEEVLLRKLISGMVPSKIQSFTESIRSGFARIGTIVASPTTPLLMSYMSWWSTILIASSIGFLLCFIARKRYLLQPIEMDFEVGKIDHLLVETNDAPKGMSEYD